MFIFEMKFSVLLKKTERDDSFDWLHNEHKYGLSL